MKINNSLLYVAMAASLSLVTPAQALTPNPSANYTYEPGILYEWSGNFSMLTSDGKFLNNSDALLAEGAAYAAGNSYAYVYYGNRTPISGTLSFDPYTGLGTGTIANFDFLAGGFAVSHDFTVQAIGDGFGGTGSLVLANWLMNWSGNQNIAISLVLDAGGLFTALPTMSYGDSINQTTCAIAGSGCVSAASDSVSVGAGKNTQFFPMGAIPIASTTYNVVNDGSAIGSGTYIDGVVVQYAANDVIGGSHLNEGPFVGFNPNLDITSVSFIASPIPVPAAVWLFSSGLLGLAGMARRRRNR